MTHLALHFEHEGKHDHRLTIAGGHRDGLDMMVRKTDDMNLAVVVPVPANGSAAVAVRDFEAAISKWNLGEPCLPSRSYHRVRLVLYTLRPLPSAMRRKLSKHVASHELFSECFEPPTFIAALSPGQTSDVVESTMFFDLFALSTTLGLEDVRHVFWLAPSCRPVRAGWVDALSRTVLFHNDFWTSGGIDHGASVGDFAISSCALYNINDGAFTAFLGRVRDRYGAGEPFQRSIYQYRARDVWSEQLRHADRFLFDDIVYWHQGGHDRSVLAAALAEPGVFFVQT